MYIINTIFCVIMATMARKASSMLMNDNSVIKACIVLLFGEESRENKRQLSGINDVSYP